MTLFNCDSSLRSPPVRLSVRPYICTSVNKFKNFETSLFFTCFCTFAPLHFYLGTFVVVVVGRWWWAGGGAWVVGDGGWWLCVVVGVAGW